MSEAPGSRFTINQPQTAGRLKSKRLVPFTIRRGSLLLCLKGYCSQPLQIRGVYRQGAPYLGPRTLDVRPYSISVLKSLGGSFVWVLWLGHQVPSVVAATSTPIRLHGHRANRAWICRLATRSFHAEWSQPAFCRAVSREWWT